MALVRTLSRVLPVCAVGICLTLCTPFHTAGADWPQYRGPTHDGISKDRLNKQWTGSVTNPMWRIVLTNCIGSCAVSGGRVFTQTRRTMDSSDVEVCVALNANDGSELWATPVDNTGYPNGGIGFDDGPRTTPAVEGGSVFVLGSYFKLSRLNATNGIILWQKDLLATYGGTLINYQNCASPLLDSGFIYINTCAVSSNLMALRESDGSLAWRSQSEAMTHSTPVLTTIQGVRQIIFATQSGLVSLDPATGNRLWKFNYPFTYSTSLAVSPVVYQDMVFVSGNQGYNMGSVAARVVFANGSWTTSQLWANVGISSQLASHWTTPVAYQGFLYGQFGVQSFDFGPNPQLKCVDMRTGAVKWSTNGFGHGATVLMDDHLVTITERGDLVLTKPVTNAYTQLGRFLAIPNYSDPTNKCWNALAVCDGRVFIRSTAFVAAFDLSNPDLRLDPPLSVAANKLQLTVRTVNGAPVNSNRLAALEAHATTNISQGVNQWPKLTNALVLTNGNVRIDNVDGSIRPRFFIVTEPK
jgi:outer membrane protein assembly factor BamB